MFHSSGTQQGGKRKLPLWIGHSLGVPTFCLEGNIPWGDLGKQHGSLSYWVYRQFHLEMKSTRNKNIPVSTRQFPQVSVYIIINIRNRIKTDEDNFTVQIEFELDMQKGTAFKKVISKHRKIII